MACVEAVIPVPNARKTTDGLYLYWFSNPSTQEMLRKEFGIPGVPYGEPDGVENHPPPEHSAFLSPSSSLTNVLRPGSPNVRTPSPPLLSHRSPKSPRASRRSPKKTAKSLNGKLRGKNGLQQSYDDVDIADDTLVPGPILHTTGLHNDSAEGSELLHNHLGRERRAPGDGSNHLGRERRARSHSPKPESLPTGPRHNHIPKPGTNSSSHHIPRFYFPNGKPQPDENLQERFSELAKLFSTFEGGEANFKQFPEVVKVSEKSQICWGISVVKLPSLLLSDCPLLVNTNRCSGKLSKDHSAELLKIPQVAFWVCDEG